MAEPGNPAPSDALVDPDDPRGRTIPVLREVLLDERAVANVRPVDDGNLHRGVEMTLTLAAGDQFHRITSDHQGRRLAILLDGRVLTAPTIAAAIRRSLTISNRHGFTPDEQAAIIRAVRSALPERASRPADR